MVADILYEVERRRVQFHRHWDYLYEDDSVANGWFAPTVELAGSVYCELDPFGRLLEDGVPTAWVFVEIPVEDISVLLGKDSAFWTHVYLDDGAWQWKTIPKTDGEPTIRYWVDRGLNETSRLSARVEIVGRMKSALKSDLERVINEARQFLSARVNKPQRAGNKANHASR